ncbi:hypothetical protein M2105_004071 [Paenibacillus sp. PastF-1]|nr:hypothetical protein [Paenibacillus sp. PastF-2]MDF9851162.1 hypothetical protein [Paenibacillus sp. PastM-2]MDF9856203.1 hypothetical protein [Paenibacillus sp. PastF-1]MDH6481568.1 hypothetical protein [Paenibacillus sp. PastH-2]MDH6510419.1 hypothetical protein [Paenibacillus sp. PastM-3]
MSWSLPEDEELDEPLPVELKEFLSGISAGA